MLTRKQQFLVIFLTFTLTISLWLGRTFPTHQYFSAQLGAGQLSLYNLLKAYSLLDTEVHTVIPTVAHFKACTVMIVVKFAITPFLNIFFFKFLCCTGWLLPGYQLCGWSSAAPHGWRAGLWHAEVSHVWPRHKAAVQTRHGLSAGQWVEWTTYSVTMSSVCVHYVLQEYLQMLSSSATADLKDNAVHNYTCKCPLPKVAFSLNKFQSIRNSYTVTNACYCITAIML